MVRSGGCVAVEDMHQLRFLERADHERASLRVHAEVLTGDDAAAPALAEGLLVHLREAVLRVVVGEHHDPAAVASDREVIAVRARQAERGEASHDPEHLHARDRLHLAVLIRAQELQRLVARDDDLLRLGRGEVAIYRLLDPAPFCRVRL